MAQQRTLDTSVSFEFSKSGIAQSRQNLTERLQPYPTIRSDGTEHKYFPPHVLTSQTFEADLTLPQRLCTPKDTQSEFSSRYIKSTFWQTLIKTHQPPGGEPFQRKRAQHGVVWSSGMTSRCGWRAPSSPIQIRASPCSIHGTAKACDIFCFLVTHLNRRRAAIVPCLLIL